MFASDPEKASGEEVKVALNPKRYPWPRSESVFLSQASCVLEENVEENICRGMSMDLDILDLDLVRIQKKDFDQIVSA